MTKSKRAPTPTPAGVIDWTGLRTQRIDYEPAAVIFAQGDPATSVMYVEMGAVRLSVLSHAGQEAVIAVLEPAIFSERAVSRAKHSVWRRLPRWGRALLSPLRRTKWCDTSMPDRLRGSVPHAHADKKHPHRGGSHRPALQFHRKTICAYVLLLARYGEPEASHRALPQVSQEILAEMIGTTRSRVNFFMNKFRKLGFIDYNGGLKINNSLLSVVLRD